MTQRKTIARFVQDWRNKLPFEPRILAAIGLLAGLVWGFAELAEDVLEQETDSFDRVILNGLRAADDPSRAIGPSWLPEMFRDITTLGNPTIITLVTVIAAAYLLTAGRVRLAVMTAVSISLGAIVEMLLKSLFGRARPDLVPHLVDVTSLSFPSGHAMLSAMTYLTLGALLAEAQTRWRLRGFVFGTSVVLTLLIGISRVYLGVHWPSDVLAGWCAGAAWALIFWFAAERLAKHPR